MSASDGGWGHLEGVSIHVLVSMLAVQYRQGPRRGRHLEHLPVASVMPALLPAWRPGSKSHHPKTKSWVETLLPLMTQLWRSQSFCHSPSVRSESQRPVVFKRRRTRPISCQKTHQSTCGHVSKHHTGVSSSGATGNISQPSRNLDTSNSRWELPLIVPGFGLKNITQLDIFFGKPLEVPPLGGSRNMKARRTQIPGLQGSPL